ncbi:MAG TPA: hypothetical protein VJ672_05515 [Gemmatimonadaceae bacterium]|nr:hypothetical protein [Gemmatimonadaceae bacterium]
MSAHLVHHPSREEIVAATSRPVPRSMFVAFAVLAIIGALVFIIGAVTGQSRAWQALHYNWLFFATLSQAGVVFVAVQRITTARWSRPVVRMLEGYVAFLPVAFLLLLLIFLGRAHIFPWAHEEVTIPEKAAYLDGAFLIGRDLLLFGIMLVLSLWYIYLCVRLDVGVLPEGGAKWARGIRDRMRRTFRDERREIHSTHSIQGTLAVLLCLGYGFFFSVLAWDLSMTLDVHFQSTLYSWWFFMGGWLAALMIWSLLVMWWRRHLGAQALITQHHFHDLGKLCFAFTTFWGYLTFGQYLVIWYGNMAEETHWMRLRLIEPWVTVTVVLVFLVFVIPFFGLMSRAAKVYLPTFIAFAISSVIGLWLLRFIEVYPSLHYESNVVPFGLWELGITLGYVGLWGLCYFAFMNAFPRMRVTLLTSPYRDEVQVPVNPETMEPLPAHEEV